MKHIIRQILLGNRFTGLLDLYPTTGAAWSLRKLRSGYGGAAIRVVRNSDSAGLDIGFIGQDLDTATLLVFGAGTDCRVTIWYDQSGNGLNRVTVGYSTSPTIVSGGSLVTLNGKVAADFTGGVGSMKAGTTSSFNYLHNGTKSFISLVQNENGAATERFINTGGSSTSQVGILVRSAATNGIGVTVATGSSGNSAVGTSTVGVSALGSSAQFIMGLALDPSNATAANRAFLYINGGSNLFANSSSTAPVASNAAQALGAPDSSSNFTGKMQEMIFWATDQTANRTAIRDNQKAYYGTY